MGRRKKTNEEFVNEIYELVGDEYEFLEEYKNSKTKIKCKHNMCRYEWGIIPSSFLRGTRCPRCAGNEVKTHEEFISEVYNLVGSEYIFLDKYVNAKTKIKCKHTKCGYEWSISPDNFLKGKGCPKCNRPNYNRDTKRFKSEIYSLVGNEYSVLGKYKSSEEKIRFKHNTCGNEFEMLAGNFLSGQRCPQCSRPNYNRDTEQFKKEVYSSVKDEYVVLGKYINNFTKIRLRHNKCKHEWDVLPNNFLNKHSRCPLCANSKGENFIAEWLKNRSIKFIIQYVFDDCKNFNSLPFDFYLPDYNLLIEYDGEQHFEPVDFAGEG